MSDFVISCCSTCDLTKEYLAKRDIKYICFHMTLGDEEHLDDLWETMNPHDMYQRMIDGADTKTSQVSYEEYRNFFEGFLKEGKDVLHVTLSSGISGTFNSASLAARELAEEYPDRKVYAVDSLCASSGFGLFMDKLADLRDEGKSVDEVYKFAEESKAKLNHWFYSTDLTFFIRGGRVSKAAGLVGSILKICPLLNVDYMGRLINREKIQSKKKAAKRALEKMVELAEDGENYSGKCFISNSDCAEDAKYLASMIEERFPKLNGKVEIFEIGATIGAHTGPGTVALFFWGKERID